MLKKCYSIENKLSCVVVSLSRMTNAMEALRHRKSTKTSIKSKKWWPKTANWPLRDSSELESIMDPYKTFCLRIWVWDVSLQSCCQKTWIWGTALTWRKTWSLRQNRTQHSSNALLETRRGFMSMTRNPDINRVNGVHQHTEWAKTKKCTLFSVEKEGDDHAFRGLLRGCASWIFAKRSDN